MRRVFFIILFVSGALSCNHAPVQERQSESPGSGQWWDISNNALLDTIAHRTFKYFYDFAHPVSGMARERSHSPFHGKENEGYDVMETVTTGGTGFGVMAFPGAVERGWISRQEAVAHLLKLTNWLYKDAERFHGMFSHWYYGSTGQAFAFSPKDNGGDIVESAFLFQGLLTIRSYFDRNNPTERQLQENITKLWEEADWDFYRNGNPWLLWHWSPDYGFEKNMPVMGFDETHIVYILAAASPTHPVPPSVYDSGWAIDHNDRFREYGDYVSRLRIDDRDDGGGPLFFTHYSYLGMSPFFRDKYVTEAGYDDYFNHHQAMALTNKAWCEQAGYPYHCWGLTSSDDPWGYSAHAPGEERDNGTITPSAAIASVIYTPNASFNAIRYFLENHADSLWGPYGFYDSFNLREDYFAPSYLAIDQGPIVIMIENYRSGLPWELFHHNQEIAAAMENLGLERTQ